MDKNSISNSENKAKATIDSAAALAVKVLDTATAERLKILTDAAAAALKVVEVKNAGDHDLLVKVDTRLEILQKSFDKQSENDKGFVLKDEFVFWRNLLVSGLLLSIFLGVVLNYIK